MAQTRCAFLELPAELRNRIYRLTLLSNDRIEIRTPSLQEPGVLAACRQIRTEAESIFHVENRFQIYFRDYEPTNLVFWAAKQRAVKARHNVKLEMQFYETDDSAPNWANLMKLLRLSHAGVILPDQKPTSALSDDFPMRAHQFAALMGMVKELTAMPWSTVERILLLQQRVMISTNDGWRS